MSGKRLGLTYAIEEKALVKFSRVWESASLIGYVLDIGSKFLLMTVFGDGFSFDGFVCCRVADIRGLKLASDEMAAMYQKVLSKRRQKIPAKPPIDVTNLKSILQSANEAFPLVTVHIEKEKPGVCHIGRIAKISKNKLWMREIDTDATWGDEELFSYRLTDVTMIEFGGDYERGLHEAGGPPPVK